MSESMVFGSTKKAADARAQYLPGESVNTSLTTDSEPLDVFASVALPEFDLSILPPALGDMVGDTASRTATDPLLPLSAGLAAVGTAIDDRIRIQVQSQNSDWKESARPWICIDGGVSSGKSPGQGPMLEPVLDMQARFDAENAKILMERSLQEEIYKAQRRAYINSMAKGESATMPDTLGPEPELPAAILHDVTIEGLCGVAARNPRGVLIYHDELSAWIGGMDAYRNSGVSKDRGDWLKAYNGGQHSVTRKSVGRLHIPNWSACLLGAIQTDSMRKIVSRMDLMGDGILQRINTLTVRPQGKELDILPARNITDNYQSLIYGLFNVIPGAKVVRLSSAAQDIREAYSDDLHAIEHELSLPATLRSHIGKMRGMFARYLLIFHCIDCFDRGIHPTTVEVSQLSAERTRRLFAEVFVPHAFNFYLETITGNSHMAHVRWIAGWILTNKKKDDATVTMREVCRAYRSMENLPPDRQMAVMESLAVAGWITEVEHRERGKLRWGVNSRVHVVHAERAKMEKERRDKAKALIEQATSGKKAK